MKADVLFVGMQLFRRNRQKHETCSYHGWCFKNKEH